MEVKQVKKTKDIKDIYSNCQLSTQLMLPFSGVGKNIVETLENMLIKQYEGKCIVEGYIKPNSIKIITYSSGIIKNSNIIFNVVYNCKVCYPVAGMKLDCVAENITKAGIRGESKDEQPSPFIVYISRDHYYNNEYFNTINKGDKFTARVIAQRFELYDKWISIIAEIVPKDSSKLNVTKPRIMLNK